MMRDEVAWLRRLEQACEHVLRDVLDSTDPYHRTLIQDVEALLTQTRAKRRAIETGEASPDV